jgi:hypothetical protein
LERAAKALARGNDWGLLLTTADAVPALDDDLLKAERDAAALACAPGAYVGIHPASTLRRVLARLGLLEGAERSTAQIEIEPPEGHVRVVSLLPQDAHVAFLPADPAFVERFVALERRVEELAAHAIPAVDMLGARIPPPPYAEPLALVILLLDDPALVRLRVLPRGAYASAERPPLIGQGEGIYVGVHAAEEVVAALKLRASHNPAAPNACAFLLQDGARVRTIVSVEDHFLLADRAFDTDA